MIWVGRVEPLDYLRLLSWLVIFFGRSSQQATHAIPQFFLTKSNDGNMSQYGQLMCAYCSLLMLQKSQTTTWDVFQNPEQWDKLPTLQINAGFWLPSTVPTLQTIWVFPKIVVPLLKSIIWGYHYFRKHPQPFISNQLYRKKSDNHPPPKPGTQVLSPFGLNCTLFANWMVLRMMNNDKAK